MPMKIKFIDQSALGGRSCFYVGGQYGGEDGRHFLCHQMFVEAYIPKEVTQPYPLIFFHGAGQTNVNWLITPDGRMGWADYFVSRGFAVYLAEQPARARSAYHPSVDGPSTFHSTEIMTSRFIGSNGGWPQSEKHTQWPGDPEDEAAIQFLSAAVEYLPSNRDSQALVLRAGVELLKLVGPAVLITHSQAGPFGWLLADACPELVKGIVAFEPGGPPFSADPTAAKAKNYGPADLPLHFEPEVTSPDDFKLEWLPAPEADQKGGWILRDDDGHSLPRLAGIPILIATAEASYHAQYDHLTARVLAQLGAANDHVYLGNVGLCGNGHMLMLEKNNLEIADFTINWLTDHVRAE